MRFLTRSVSILVFAVVGLVSSASISRADDVIPIAPCRVLDTRNISAGTIPAGTQFNFKVRNYYDNTGTLVSPGAIQGGSTSCGVPTSATGIQASIVAVNPSSTGHVLLWPYGATMPITSVLNVTTAETNNSGLFGLLGTGAFDLSLRGSGLNAAYVIDITGYTVPSTATLVGQAIGIQFGHVLVIETVSGQQVRAFVPASLATFKDSWIDSLPLAVGSCAHIDGFWTDGNTVGEGGIFEARSLPIIADGYCGPESSAEAYEASSYSVPQARVLTFLTFTNAPLAPEALTPGDTFVVFNGVGAFAGHDREFAIWNGSTWIFEAPHEGDLAMDISTAIYYRYRVRGFEEWRALTMASSGI